MDGCTSTGSATGIALHPSKILAIRCLSDSPARSTRGKKSVCMQIRVSTLPGGKRKVPSRGYAIVQPQTPHSALVAMHCYSYLMCVVSKALFSLRVLIPIIALLSTLGSPGSCYASQDDQRRTQQLITTIRTCIL